MSDLNLRVNLTALDRATGPMRKAQAAARGLAGAYGQLRQLQDQRGAIDTFRRLQTQFKTNAQAAQGLREHLKGLRAQMGPQTAAAAKALAAEIKAAEAALKKTSAAADAQSTKMQRLRNVLAGMGIKNLAADETALAARIERTTQAIERQNKARAQAERMGKAAAIVTGTGWAARTAGTGMLNRLRAPLDEGRKNAAEIMRITALNLGDKATADAIKYAKAMKAYGTSTTDNLGLMKDALTAFADEHHAEMVMPTLARMKFANEAMFGEAEAQDNERKFMDMLRVIELRGGLKNEAEFKAQANTVQRLLTATGGRVGPGEWLEVIKTGGIAAKGLTSDAFFNQLEPLVQEMGGFRVGTALMSAYNNVYQGKTTKRAAMMMDSLGLVADPSKVKHDKVGQIAQLGVGAIKGSDLFQQDQFAWMEQVLVPALNAKGLTTDKQVIDAIGGIFSNRTASNLFAQMYLQREQIHKNARLNAGAMGIDDMHALAMQTPQGKEIEAAKRLHDVYNRLSTAAMPTYTAALEKLAGAFEGLNGFLARNPALAKAVGVGLGAIAVGLLALGTLLIPVGLLLAKFALLRYAAARLGLAFNPIARAAALLRGAWGTVAPLLARAGAGLLWLGRAGAQAFLLLGRAAFAFLATPLGIAFALVAAAVALWVARWDDIKGGAILLWQDITAAFTAGLTWLQALPQRLWQAGSDMIGGLINGITSRLSALKSTIVGAADSAAQWFKGQLGINSPSRVFMQLGGWVSEGAAQGIAGRAPLVARAAAAMAALPALAAAPALAAGVPALGAAGAGPAAGPTAYHITVNAAPGQDPQAIARAVAAELDRRDRARAARGMSALTDR